MDNLAQAKVWQQEADQLLTESKLLDVLKQHGQPLFTGSYEYQLMANGDIDLYLITKSNTQTVAQKLLQKLVKEGWWNGYMLFDWVNWHRDHFPSGFYVGVKTDFEDHRWKVDIWVLNEFPSEQAKYNQWLLSKLNEENKTLILNLKAARNDNDWPQDSKTIYDAVLKDNITTTTEFVTKYHLDRKP